PAAHLLCQAVAGGAFNCSKKEALPSAGAPAPQRGEAGAPASLAASRRRRRLSSSIKGSRSAAAPPHAPFKRWKDGAASPAPRSAALLPLAAASAGRSRAQGG